MKNKKADSKILNFTKMLGKEYTIAKKSIIRETIDMAMRQIFQDYDSADHTAIKEAFDKGRHFIV